jgi:NAD(P)-dependent dehydrogenase (short-subunit alcohol dehydrogenase family)
VNFPLSGAGVVITGAGSGIGAALARRFATEGARLVLSDLNGDAVKAVADEVGAISVAADAAGQDGIEQLIGAAKETLGAIDLFCANAGIAPHGGPETPEDVWARAWDVNVMSHVRASKVLLPEWLERGKGHFLATVSAAGLLTSLGSAPYAVTKHGALGYAEWLSATYRHRGITVQALCPQGVRTNMLEASGPGGKLLMDADAIEPEQLADHVVETLGGPNFLILPHPEVADYYAARATQTDRWLGGMNKLQRKVEEALGE